MMRVRICALVAGIGLATLTTTSVADDYGTPNQASSVEQNALVWPAELGAWAPVEDIHHGLAGTQIGVGLAEAPSVQLASAQQEVPAGQKVPAIPQAPVVPQAQAPVAPTKLPERLPPQDTVVVEDGSAVGIQEGSPELWRDSWSAFNACCQAGLVGGAEGVFLAPIGEPDQEVVLTDLTTGEVFSETADPGLGAGLRTWVGLQRNGWGFRFQYLTFGNDEADPEPDVPFFGEPAFSPAYHLHAYAVDIELTQGLCFGQWRIDSSFGGRYARLERNAAIVGYGTVGNGVDLYGFAMGAHEVEGPGLTFSIGGRRQLACLPCGWQVFWRYRGSLLWTDSLASALTEATAITKEPMGVAHSRDKAFACEEQDVYISEVQAGIQYERCLQCCPAVFFFRTGFEFQHWGTGDIVARTNSFAYLHDGDLGNFGGRVDAFSDAHDGDLSLIGFMVGAGLTY